jgi:hypothetical protein
MRYLFFLLLLLGGCKKSSQEEFRKDIFYIEYYKDPRYSWGPPYKSNYQFSYIAFNSNFVSIDEYFYAEDRKIENFGNPFVRLVGEGFTENFYGKDVNYSNKPLDYQWGYRYKIEGFVAPLIGEDSISIEMKSVILKEKVFEPFTITFVTEFESEYLIEKISNRTYLAYNELEFDIYQDLEHEFLEKMERNSTITLSFDFEENGTIYLKDVL